MTYLLMLSIGPVQSFISQARKLQDLCAGSEILSKYARKAAARLKENGATIIFPDLDLESAPNRIVAEIVKNSSNEVETLCKNCEEHLRHEFSSECNEIISKYKVNTNQAMQNQIERFLQIYWAAVPYDNPDEYIEVYKKLIFELSSAKCIREFTQTSEQGARKCTLSGDVNALIARKRHDGRKIAYLDDDAVSFSGSMRILQKNEALGAVSFMKRCYEAQNRKPFPSTAEIAVTSQLCDLEKNGLHPNLVKAVREEPRILFKDDKLDDYDEKDKEDKDKLDYFEKVRKDLEKFIREKNIDKPFTPYYAIISFDGDKMGEAYSKPPVDVNEKEYHSTLSRKIGMFAKSVRSTLKMPETGIVVYAGGEDFLGLVNLTYLFSVLGELYDDFKNKTGQKFSAGVCMSHYKTPLSESLQWCRKMLNEAKEYKGKNAFSVAVIKHSGEIEKVRRSFNNDGSNQNILPELECVLGYIVDKKFSTNFIYTLIKEFTPLLPQDEASANQEFKKNKNYEIFKSELHRMLRRSKLKETTDEELYDIQERLTNVFSTMEPIERLNMMKVLAFIARERCGC